MPTIIKIREVEADGVTFVNGSDYSALLFSDPFFGPGHNDQGIMEAPWIVYREPYYYLFFSTYFYFSPNYNVGVARSKSVTGPYKRHDEYVVHVDQDRLEKGTTKFVGTGKSHRVAHSRQS